MKSMLCVFVLSMVCIYSKAQIDIAVKFPNKELIEYNSTGKTIHYSYEGIFLQIEGEGRYYFPEEIEYVKTNELFLVSKSVQRDKESDKELIQPIIKGFMSLYQSRNMKGEKCLYIQKADSIIYFISKRYFKGYIYALFSDCSELDLKMEKGSLDNFEYNLSNIFDLITRYNKYMGSGSESVVYKEPSLLLKNYLSVGSTITTISMDDYPYADRKFPIIPSPYIGFTVGVDYLDRFGCYLGLNYMFIRSKSNYTSKGTRLNDNHLPIVVDVDINHDFSVHCLELPLAFSIKPFKFKNISPYFEFGPKLNIIIKNGSTITADDNYKHGIDYSDYIRLNACNISGFLNIGTEISKFSKIINLNLGLSKMTYLSSPITSYAFYNNKSKVKFMQYTFSLRIFL